MAHHVKQPPPEFGKYLIIDRSLIGIPPTRAEAEAFDALAGRIDAGAATIADRAAIRRLDDECSGTHPAIRRLRLRAEESGPR